MNNRTLLLLVSLAVLLLPGIALAQTGSAEEFVIATHYPNFGDTEPAPDDAIQPAYAQYNNRETDYHAVPQARAEELVQRIAAGTFLEADEIALLNDWAEVEENSSSLQIVNNVPIEGALYTLFLPPGWHRDAELPVILSGNGATISNNRALYSGDITAATISLIGNRDGQGGLIAALSNCGGTESQGVDETTLRSVGAFFDFIDENGGDKTNAVTAGGSRGGGTALVWAANPLNLDYDVRAVFAAVPPTHYGSLSQVSILTYPSMAGIGATVAQDDTAWRYDSDSPMRPGMTPSPFLEVLLGTDDPAEADQRSAFGYAERLRGKQIVISEGTHDSYFPLSLYLAFDRELSALSIPHTTIVTLAHGHEGDEFFINTLFLYLTGLANGAPPQVPDGRFYFIDAGLRPNNEMSLAQFFAERGIEAEPDELPVIAQFPYKAGVSNPIDVEVCGTAGDEVALSAASEDGETLYAITVTLDETECHTQTLNADVPTGTYHWTLVVNGEVVNPRNTPSRDEDGCGLLATTTIEADQPDPRSTFAYNGDLSFGLDEYSGQNCDF